MKKNTLRAGIALGVLLVLYHLIVFLIPFRHTAVFWVAYGFTLAAFAVVAAACCIAFVKAPDARSKFYGFPIARLAVLYGLAQLLVSILFMALSAIAPVWLAVLIFALGLGAAAIGLVAADAVRENIVVQDAKQKRDVALMRGLQSKLNPLSAQCENPDAARAVKAFAEELRYSDPVSSEALAEIEADLAAAVDELQQAVVEGDSSAIKQLCRKATTLLTERNRLCKLHK